MDFWAMGSLSWLLIEPETSTRKVRWRGGRSLRATSLPCTPTRRMWWPGRKGSGMASMFTEKGSSWGA